MKKYILLLHFTFCVFYFAGAQQAPGIQWQNTIGGSYADGISSIIQTSDGGYMLGGSSNSNISGDKTENCLGSYDYWILKLDATGNIQWQNTIGGNGADDFAEVQHTLDGGYIIGGFSDSNISGDKTENCLVGYDYWILKLDATGNIQWQNTIGGSNDDKLTTIKPTLDSGFILGGYSNSDNSADKTENSLGTYDYWVIKLDSLGGIEWQNTIGGNDIDWLYSIQQTTDKGYIIGGLSYSNVSSDKTENSFGSADYWLVKLDSIGNIQWQNTIGGNNFDRLSTITQSSDGGYILGGYSNSIISGDKTENCFGQNDYWIIKCDSAGVIQWQNTIGGNKNDALGVIEQTSDGGYILGGISDSDISGDKTENSLGDYDYWIIKLSGIGNIQWQNTIGGSDWDNFRSIRQTNDYGYILGGESLSNISGDKTENSNGDWDYWIVKLYPDTITSTTNPTPSTSGIQIFPNPFTDEITITLNYPNYLNTPITISVFDVVGKQIFSTRTTTSNLKLQTSNYPAGVYFVKVNAEVKKIIKIK